MRWRNIPGSGNVEDRRGMGGGRIAGGFGIGTIIIFILVMLFGGDPSSILGTGGPAEQPAQTAQGTPEDEMGQFVGAVLTTTEEVWNRLFPQQYNANYREPRLVLFSQATQSGCGFASSATGPFYCPADERVYIDLSFYEELKSRFQAPGDFAMAYIIWHEVGHHVQNLLGITDQMQRQRGRISEEQYNDLSVRLELQADFLAGVWAHHAQEMRNILEQGDIEEAMRAAAAVGDDRIQMQNQGYVVPESFTHGTSEQRMRWFRKGFDTGDLKQGDTFSARNL